MTEAVISLSAEAAKYLVKPISQHGRYLFCANLIIQNLVEEKNQLSTKIEEIQKRIQEEEKATKLIDEPVKNWVTEAKNILEAAENLKQEMEANKNCFQGWCPPWRRYCMLKQMAKKTHQMRKQIKNSEIKPFSRLMPISDIDYDCSDSFTYFHSTKKAYNEILEALQDDNTKIIGLYGMGGCGKTALVKEVRKEAKKLQLFDVIILVTVSQTSNINAIQDQMAKKLELELKEENEEERAARLWQSLKQRRDRVLIIVDDVWRQFTLKLIGIAFDKNHEGSCKVLLTSRNREVCASMECQREVELHLLSEEEAWTLFQKCARIDDHSPEKLLNMAREVSKRCKGLPIALRVVGSSLKGKRSEFQVDQLNVALQIVKKGGGEGDVFKCLRFSYDYLETEEAKRLLLMCAMFPEDHEIHFEDLIRYGIGLGVCGEFNSFDSARCQIRMGISELLDSCLLMYDDKWKRHLKMHDLIHEMALSISQQMDPIIMVDHEKDLNFLTVDKVKQCYAISSWCNETNQLPRQFNAPKLEILMVNTARNSMDLSFVSFEFTKRLKVMAITNEFSRGHRPSISLPQSIQSLTNLKTLRLKSWQLGDISFMLSLEGLEVLDLQRCTFDEVPDKIEKLHNLKLLDLRGTRTKNYNSKAIRRCPQLEELYVSGSYEPGYAQPHQCFLPDLTPRSLQRYNLELGRDRGVFVLADSDSVMRIILLEGFNVSTNVGSEKNLLQRANYVCFINLCGGYKNIVPDIDQAVGCMNELNMLSLRSCSEIECLFDATSNHASSFQGDVLLPCRLTALSLDGMENLTEVCHGEPFSNFFEKLEALLIRRCQQLHSIFPPQCNLENLETLSIGYILDDGHQTNCKVVNLFSMSIAKNMQRLKCLAIRECSELRHIITEVEDGTNTREDIFLAPNNPHLLFPNLKTLTIARCPKLRVIFAISYAQQNDIQTMLPRLQEFKLHDLENLLEISPQTYHSGWPFLRTLSWRNCPKLKASWIGVEPEHQHLNKEVVPCEDHQKPLTSKLENLTLIDLPELTSIWFDSTATQILSFQDLQCLVVEGLKEKKFIFSIAVLRSLSKLTFLKIGNCDELVEIIVENEESKNFAPVEVFFPKLRTLLIEQCNKLKNLFSVAMIRVLPQLTTLDVSEAAQLKEIFGQSSEEDIVNEVETMVPNLTTIYLRKLQSFVNIHQGFMLHKLKLQSIVINGCPKFTPILGATQAIPLHRRTEEKLILCPIAVTMNQLSRQQMHSVALKAFLSIKSFTLENSGVEGIFQLQLVEEGVGGMHKYLNSNLRELRFSELPELRFIWSGPTQFLKFDELRDITVEGCPKLKFIFPAGVVGSLKNLLWLNISNCEELEEIFDLQVECFPKISFVTVKKCNKLKCIFYKDCMASHNYASLRSLCVTECSQLERICGLKHTTEANNKDHGEREVLLDLKELELGRLPNFIGIGQGIKLTAQPSYYKVKECPKYIQQFSVPNTDSDEDIAGSSQC